MDNSKITAILGSFSKYDINSFEKFLASPWFTSDKRLLILFRCFLKESNKFDRLSKFQLYKSVTGKSKFNDKEMRYLLSALTRCIENYLACKELFSDEPLLMHLRMKSLAARDIEKAYTYEHGLFIKHMHEKKGGDAMYYLQSFLNLYQHLNYSHKKSTRKKIIRFDEVMLELDRFYVAKKLQLYAELLNAQNILAADYKIYLADEIRKLALEKDFIEIPVIALYYHVLMTLTESNGDDSFKALRLLLPTYGHLLPVVELNDLYQYVRNYCIKKINLGDAYWSSVLFDIYKEILSNKKLMKLDYLSQWEYKNITTLGLRLGQLDWVEKFIKKYNYNLMPEQRKNAFVYNMANLHFYEKKYHLTLKMFQKVEFTDVYYQLDTRSILLKVYYEQEDEDVLFFHAASFKTFLSRNKLVSTYHKTSYKNFVNFTLRLIRAGTNKKKLQRLQFMLSQTPQVADAPWIKQKLEELL